MKTKNVQKNLKNDMMVLAILELAVIIISFVRGNNYYFSIGYLVFLLIGYYLASKGSKLAGILGIIVSALMVLPNIILISTKLLSEINFQGIIGKIIEAIAENSVLSIIDCLLGIFILLHSIKYLKSSKHTKLTIEKGNLITMIIYAAVIIIPVTCFYYFFGIIEAGMIGIGLLFVLLIGYFLDKPKTKTKRRKVIKIIIVAILSLGILGLLAGCGFIYYIVKNAPDFKEELFKAKESTIIYDSSGKEYAKLGLELRENIEYDQLSEVFIDALIATEDSRFFQHNGFDLMRFVKAAFGQAIGQGDSGGGSTLTMQLSKNTLTNKDTKGFAGIVRKFTDIYISIFQIERNYTKEQIIEFYANNHTLGGLIYGVQEAAKYFFNKDAKDLNLSEAAIIAGMYQAPTSYNPFNHPQAAAKRRKTVLYLMERHGYITSEERKLADSIPIESLLVNSSTQTNEYQGYIDLVCDEAIKKYGVDPYTTPMLVYTNMIRSNQDGINKIYNNNKTGSFSWKDEDMQAGIAVIDSTNGKITAIGAGRNKTGAKSFSYATFDSKSQRQIGSTAKPLFDYGPGMEYNNWSTYTLFVDEPYTYSNGKKISNFDSKYEGTITLRRALSNSRNIPALKAFQSVDNKKIIDFVTSIGITPEITNGYIHEAHAIGAFTGSNPLAMAGAYQIYSNGGYYYEPYSISKIVFRDSNAETIEYSSPKVKIISDSTSYMITDVLKGVPNSTTKSGLSKDHFAAKTGTTNVDSTTKTKNKLPSSIVRDYWIMGYTHNVVIGIWIGYDKLNSKHYLNYNSDGWRRHALLNAVAKVCFKHDGIDFTKPNSVVASKVEKGSNPPKLPSAETPSDQILTELFKRGTEPTEVSTKYLSVDAPSNLSVVNYGSYVTLSWSAVTDPEYVENGVLGYYVYFNDQEIGFTENTSYTISNQSSYYGTYSVRAGYKGTDASKSAATSYELVNTVYKVYTDPKTTTYTVGEAINSSLYNGSAVVLTANGSVISSGYNIEKTITNSSGSTVETPISTSPETYTITYKVTYKGLNIGTCSNKIIIKEDTSSNENDTSD